MLMSVKALSKIDTNLVRIISKTLRCCKFTLNKIVLYLNFLNIIETIIVSFSVVIVISILSIFSDITEVS